MQKDPPCLTEDSAVVSLCLIVTHCYKMMGPQRGPCSFHVSVWHQNLMFLLLMFETGERFSAIRLHCSCWRCLNVTPCHLYLAGYLWRIRKLHLQTTKWTQKCKVHRWQLFFSPVCLRGTFFFCFNSPGTQTGFIACIRCSTYSPSKYLWGIAHCLALLLVCFYACWNCTTTAPLFTVLLGVDSGGSWRGLSTKQKFKRLKNGKRNPNYY